MWTYNYLDELCHHGVLGMKWGRHTGIGRNGTKNSIVANKTSEKKKVTTGQTNNNAAKVGTPIRKEAKLSVDNSKNLKLSDVKKKNIDTGIRIGTDMLAAYGAYKLAENAFGNF